MAFVSTTDQLKTLALELAQEPTDGSSQFDARAVDYMNEIYLVLTQGGTIGVRDLATSAGLYTHVVDIATSDWLWLRKFPPFCFNTTPAMIGANTSVALGGPPPITLQTVTLTFNSTTVTFNGIAPPLDVTGWRIKLLNQTPGIEIPPITVPRIEAHTAGAFTATIDCPWPQDTETANGNFVLWQAEYELPSDFARFAESPFVFGGWPVSYPPRLAIGSAEQVFDQFPLMESNQGPPNAAARISPTTIMMNRWDTQSYRIEFSYIIQPDALVTGQMPPQEPLLPVRHRPVLSYGAAMYIMQDKADSKTSMLASQTRELIMRMTQEYRKELQSGSELNGRHLFRQQRFRTGRYGLLRTSSGLPLF
jgi:hypothetical protein